MWRVFGDWLYGLLLLSILGVEIITIGALTAATAISRISVFLRIVACLESRPRPEPFSCSFRL